ncbi:hypothetical protein PHMEG_00036418, partial [Phytophthora megakarya]
MTPRMKTITSTMSWRTRHPYRSPTSTKMQMCL